jgi:hypothetical protein
MGDTRAESKRRRAVGTRGRIMSRLAQSGAISDENGMASAVLAREVGYPGSSVAFAQLLSGMERSGLIEREVRGKRTYRISAAPGAALDEPGPAPDKPARRAARRASADPAHGAELGVPGPRSGTGGGEWGPAGPGQPVTAAGGPSAAADRAATGPGDFDYDELARRLLVEVVRRLAAAPAQAAPPPPPAPPAGATLEQTVAGLEQELASVRTMHGTLTEENARLRQQLQAARRSLALARRAAGQPVTDQLDAAEVSLLERLLAHSADKTRAEDTG